MVIDLEASSQDGVFFFVFGGRAPCAAIAACGNTHLPPVRGSIAAPQRPAFLWGNQFPPCDAAHRLWVGLAVR